MSRIRPLSSRQSTYAPTLVQPTSMVTTSLHDLLDTSDWVTMSYLAEQLA